MLLRSRVIGTEQLDRIETGKRELRIGMQPVLYVRRGGNGGAILAECLDLDLVGHNLPR